MGELRKPKLEEEECLTVASREHCADYSLNMKMAFWCNESLKVGSSDTVLFHFYEKSQKIFRWVLETGQRPRTPENIAEHEKRMKVLNHLLTLEPMVKEHWDRSMKGLPLPKM